jgi:ATP:corrinoid adenosyltransferase
MIIVYTGRGKGKTSSGIATAIRSMIAGKKVGYIQFMKSEGNDASKLSSYFPELDFYSFGTKAFVDPKNISEDAKKEQNLVGTKH